MASTSNTRSATNRTARARKQVMYIEVSSSAPSSDHDASETNNDASNTHGDAASETSEAYDGILNPESKPLPSDDDEPTSDYESSVGVSLEVPVAASSSPVDTSLPAPSSSIVQPSSSKDEAMPTWYASTNPGDMATFLDTIYSGDDEVAQSVTCLRFSAIFDTPTDSGLIESFGIDPNNMDYSPPLEHERGFQARICRRLRLLLRAVDKPEAEKLVV
ncbi:hypothetical protein PtrSN002B_000308 [Pyrenophora tritici-repentis]|uniref:TT-ORF1 multi-domain protein n=2 Tax=Pyrenophora tritici-repentis TaxID=45151 RepID=A0A2W1FMW4_9PLEO|nr:uncharacterized protein PTRG_02765 [Pyrenophora tritici-repentis Pt-1C-BFP]KAA8623165.1 hypothetical protein PtrV1_04471 [Pyrenophora tritici-repentis]EDU45288.1 predicted protein [Pyrenophora tritici-repentis Pt-1C-BFP]KAF7452159.1 hypothetical protein A1F99_039360 [Pyrenophora tritici-repentis]KAF7574723.1 TT-ORF1 multi-domain protein [Pyrenophora tritici-repentis]KAG9386504.1 hypothetical protein A1F94_003254 [Pyrenophora tritici-repentis]